MKLPRSSSTEFLLQIANCKLQIANCRQTWTVRIGRRAVKRGQGSSFIPHPSSLILHPSSFILHPSKKSQAFSILEVILALAILTGAMAVLGELARLGFRNAKTAQDLTRAQLLCESKLAEFTSGIAIPEAVDGAVFDAFEQDSDIPWVYSVALEPIDEDGLIALRVTVTQSLPATQRPTSFSLVQWITDPTLQQSADSTQASSTSSSTTGNTNAQ